MQSGATGNGFGALFGALSATIDSDGTQNEASFAGATVNADNPATGGTDESQYLVVKISAHRDWTGYLSRINVTWTQSA